MRAPITPLGAVVRGAVAGAAGTLAMDAVWYRRYRKGGGTQTFLEWETASGLSSWEDAAVPAQVGRRLFEGPFQRELSPRWARLTTNVVHWGYGLAWGAQHGIVAASVTSPRTRMAVDAALGPVAWASGYAVLPLAGLYQPIWRYGVRTLARDLGAHLAFGTGTAAAFRILGGTCSALPQQAQRP